MEGGAAAHVELTGITKRFGATVAVNAATVAVRRGSIHALVGENGAGKSTLGNVIAGVHAPDGGELRVSGRPAHFRSPRSALQQGITTIAQELSLVPALRTIDNVFLGIEDHLGPIVLDGPLRLRFDRLVGRSGIEVPAEALVRDLSIAEQQKVEILRALARQAELVIMDEPTARLSSDETESLHRTMRSLADEGTTIIFISHFLEEVLEVSDVVTVMRDGHIVRTRPTSEETHESLIEAMIGRRLEATFPSKRRPLDDALEMLRVQGLTRTGVFENISFSVMAGEIVVLAGLVGSGRSEVARAIFGADPSDGGVVRLMGNVVDVRSPRDAIALGIGMVPESRKDQGLVAGRSVRENVSLPYLDRFSRGGVIAQQMERRRARKVVNDVAVQGASTESLVRSVSGGNQQKVLFARWLMEQPTLLIADEPTRGIDVGAKRNIYDLIAGLAADGVGVLVISSELEEVRGLAHRILVMHQGRLAGELDGETATEQDVMAMAFGAGAAA